MQGILDRAVAIVSVAIVGSFGLGVSSVEAIECERPGGLPAACVAFEGRCLCDFEGLPEGHILDSADFPPSVTFSVLNNVPTHPDEAIIFDTSCPGGCSGGDTDLRTPGAGVGNDTAQGNVMIIAENIDGAGDDGLVDDPDDEHDGGTITLTFGVPYKLLGLKALDHERPDELIETPSRIEMDTVGGGLEIVQSLLLGDSSLETIVIPDPKPLTEIRMVHWGSGGFDDLELVCACGDGIPDEGEECDPPASLGGEEDCSDLCTLIEPQCGDGKTAAPEECDPPASQGGVADCRDDCTLTVCGDGMTEGTEQCDPPGGICRADCTLEMCGDGIMDPGEDCDPPESQGGVEGCLDDCTLDVGPECGDEILDDGEECDPPSELTGCNENCTLSFCGDEMVEAGEECDPPSIPMGCNEDCTMSFCGDDVVEAGEECDPPNEQLGCNEDCSLSDCGDDEVEAGEECDPPGSPIGDTGLVCTSDCRIPMCGDDVVEGGEECEPPSVGDCRDDCTLIVCGDDVVEGNEECEPPSVGDCREDCTLIVCGDDVVEGNEECEPPSVGDCRDDCTLIVCGDDVVEGDEECEPPSVGDCREDCTLIVCGDDVVEGNEECEPPSVGDCREDCTLIVCGDDVVEGDEECEPPSVGDCRADCTLTVCGDDLVEGNEECEPPSVGDCRADCTLTVCGDDLVEGNEECEPPSVGDCRVDCTLMVCGDDVVEGDEECEPPSVGNCRADCTLTECGDGIVEGDEACDPGTGDPGCRDDCTVMECGDGIVDPGEECEPPGVGNCRANCTLIICGDEVVEGPEECDPPQAEICNNMMDDDGDNLADCQDPDCVEPLEQMMPVCNQNCIFEPVGCTPIIDDPAIIRMDPELQRSSGRLDYFKIHGRVRLDPPFEGGPIDPVADGFAVTLRNANGGIYTAELLPGDFTARTKKRFRYKDRGAKDGSAKRDGLYAVLNRFRRFEREWYYVFRIKAYADFSGATTAEMTTQVYGVDGPGYMTVEWVESPRGWKLRRKDFVD